MLLLRYLQTLVLKTAFLSSEPDLQPDKWIDLTHVHL